MKATNRIALLLACATGLRAHDVISTKLTWSQEVSRIVYRRCAGCHRPGGSAPMAFVAYQETRPWAKAIKEEILERRMPPGGAVKGFGEFIEDNSLTSEEIHLLADWVEGGAPEGDPQFLPPLPSAATVARSPATPRIWRDGTRLGQAVRVSAVRPADGPLQAIAELPDGSRFPLLWIAVFRPAHARTYRYRIPLELPRGTVIRISGPGSLTVSQQAR